MSKRVPQGLYARSECARMRGSKECAKHQMPTRASALIIAVFFDVLSDKRLSKEPQLTINPAYCD